MGNLLQCEGGRFDGSAGWKLFRIDLHAVFANAHLVGVYFFGEGRRRAAVARVILISMPGTGDAPADDFPLGQWAALMDTGSSHGGNFALVLKDGNRFVFDANSPGSEFGDVGDRADIDPGRFLPAGCHIAAPLREAGSDM